MARNKIYDDIDQAYLGTLRDIYFCYDFKAAPRGIPVRECLDYSFTIRNPVARAITTLDPERNKVIESYTRKETELYDSCSNRVEDFAKASKFWEKLACPDGTVNSAYGYLIWKKKSHGNIDFEMTTQGMDPGRSFRPSKREEWATHIQAKDACIRTPWQWAKESLIADKDTRQAILRFSLPEHQWKGNKDQTCTMHGNFLIREDKLFLSIVMRSNDLVLGLVYDLPWFISLMDKMIEELKPVYPNLTKGDYTHTVHSLHIYERDEEKVLKMLGDK